MVLNNLRKISEKLIKKPVNWMIRHDISPNTLTVIGFLFAACAGVTFAFPNIFIYTWYLAWIPIMFIILAGYMDLLDGGVARTAKKTTKFGGFLDSTLDRISDSIFYLGFMLGNMFYPKDQLINDLIAYLLITTSILISYIRSRAENEGVFMKGVGLMERAERTIALMLGYIVESSLYS
ncbi:MAG: CDP-alcohol phosphatidyltransferase family protein, partial [Promethearchaeota archaeon]